MQRDSVRWGCGLMQFVRVLQLVISSHHHMQPAASPCARARHVVLTKSDSPSTSCTFWKQILSRLSWLLVIARARLTHAGQTLQMNIRAEPPMSFTTNAWIPLFKFDFLYVFFYDIWVLARTVGGRKFAIKSNLNPLSSSLLAHGNESWKSTMLRLQLSRALILIFERHICRLRQMLALVHFILRAAPRSLTAWCWGCGW